MKKIKSTICALFCSLALLCASCLAKAAEQAAPRQNWERQMREDLKKGEAKAEGEMKAAGAGLQKAGEELAGGAKPAPEKPKTAKKPEPPREPIVYGTRNATVPRSAALQGSPETGYAGTWTDPATGDVLTSVVAPEPRPDNTQSYPLYVDPIVNPGIWNNGNGHYPGYNNGVGWQPEWPGYPGDGGYNPPPPNSWNGPDNSWNGRPFNPPYGYQPPAFGPGYSPGFPPPNHPGYRPLRPNNPSVWSPGMNPPPYAGTPPWQQGGSNPGHNPNFNNGYNPGQNMRPLPMRPGGQTWNNGAGGGIGRQQHWGAQPPAGNFGRQQQWGTQGMPGGRF